MRVRRDGLLETVAGLPNEIGTWGYHAGTSGTLTVPAGARVLGIAAHSTGGGTMTINGGDSVPVPANVGVEVAPRGNLIGPTIQFISTDTYFVEYLQ